MKRKNPLSLFCLKETEGNLSKQVGDETEKCKHLRKLWNWIL